MSVSLALLSICICWFGCVFQICSACGFGFAAEFKSLTILPCFPNLLRLRSQIWKRVTFALFVRISAMQIIGSGQIVTSLHLLYQHFFAALRFWVFFFCLALLLILLCSLECAREFRSCGSEHGLCPLDSHKPLKRLDRNFYMIALLLLCRTCGAAVIFGVRT